MKVITPILGGLADDLEKENERLREWQATLLELTGTSRPDHVLSVVQTTAERLAEREADLQELCEAAGVSHKGNLLQKLRALGQKKPELQLPDWATFFPNHWVMETALEKTTGWKNGLRVENLYKAKAVTALQAQRKLDRIKPTLLQVLEELNWDPAQVDEVKDAFLTLSAEKFQEALFDFLRNKATGEEEDGGEATATQAETELEAKVEDLRIAAAETGEDFDEDAARCLLLSEA